MFQDRVSSRQTEAVENKKHGPHGGSWLKTEQGFVEISVFETGVPPRFRLYFYNFDAGLIPVPLAGDVKLETIRQGEQRQTFTFKQEHDYLEATAELPEPHEFTVKLMLTHQGRVQSYQTQFTEEDHSHDAGSTHSQNQTGVLGWLFSKFGHSHGDGHSHSHGHSHSAQYKQSSNK